MSENDTLSRLQEAETAEAQLDRLRSLSAEAPKLREQAEAEQRQAYEAQRLESSKAQAALATQIAKPQLEALRAEFRQWATDGWELLQRLDSIERPLVNSLAGLAGVAAAEARSRLPAGDEEAMIMHDFLADVAQALEEVGALADDLEALPPGGNQFAQELKGLFARYAKCYHPAQRGRQFRSGGPI